MSHGDVGDYSDVSLCRCGFRFYRQCGDGADDCAGRTCDMQEAENQSGIDAPCDCRFL